MEKRITELEIKLAYQDDTIQQLDGVICQQQKQIDALQKQLNQLMGSMDTSADGTSAKPSLFDELPPHY
ncbi:MAG: SlyX family protein [Cycloclasticus sp.]|nr:SlyX family protein [Cycloclasticus sp.]